MNDLTYTTSGMFTAFLPETKAGEDAWRVMNAQDNGDRILTVHLQAVLRQLRAAGYKVAKAKKVVMGDIDEMLAELGV
jgi:hypothetical protein